MHDGWHNSSVTSHAAVMTVRLRHVLSENPCRDPGYEVREAIYLLVINQPVILVA